MNQLVPRALLPQHADQPSRQAALARSLLYVRSHWIKMPAVLLARHLAYKFHIKGYRRRADAGTA